MGKWSVGGVLLVSLFCMWGMAPMAEGAGCPNEAARVGQSAALPDCRSYELVTPADSNGRLVETFTTFGLPGTGQVVPSEIVSPSGDDVTFLTYQAALPDIDGAGGVADVYGSQRSVSGWDLARLLSVPGSRARIAVPQGVSADHLYSFNRVVDPDSPLAIEREPTLYLVGPGNSVELAGVGSLASEPYAQGRYLGDGGKHVIFSTGSRAGQSFLCSASPHCETLQLEPGGAPTGTGAVYDREVGGITRVVSLLPNDTPAKTGEDAFYRGTSKDGTATAFAIEGSLYVRLDNDETKEVASGNPIFAGVSDDGNYVFYVVPAGSGEAGVIHRYDTATGQDASVNPGDEGLVVNVSGDGSHVYFISEAQLEGGEGSVGEPNLYVWRGGLPNYVATVAPSDLIKTSNAGNLIPALGNWTSWVTNKPKNGEQGPGADSSRTNSDGRVLVFESRAQLTDYDNANPAGCPSWTGPGPDQELGTPDDELQNPEGRCTEIYRYDDDEGSLICISCNEITGIPTHDAQLQDLIITPASNIVHNVSSDGSRVFFETEEALVAGDVDGVNDVYEWQEGGGGSVSLISSGQSARYPYPPGFDGLPVPNVIFSITPTGDDVLFISQDALVTGAPGGGASAIYDARVNGGFPLTVSEPCLEEGCKAAVSSGSPPAASQASESLQGSGNVKPKRHKHKCQRKKHKKCRKQNHRLNRRPARASAVASISNTEVEPMSPSAEDAASARLGDSAPEASQEPAPQRPPSAVAAAVGEPFVEYGIEKAGAKLSTTAAGMHPDFSPSVVLNHTFKEDGKLSENMDRTEEVSVSIPPGLLGNINAVPRCTTGQLVAVSCPTDSQVGITTVYVTWVGPKFTEPIYNLVPPHPDKEVARLGFTAGLFPTFIDVKVRTASDYGVTATVFGSSGTVSLVGAETTLWGNPASPVHNKQRLTPTEATQCKTACEAENEGVKGERASTIPLADRKAFMTNPSACQSGQVDFAVTSYQLPGQTFTASAPLEPITGCTGLPFAPSFEAEPTSHEAGAPTGLKTKLLLPQHLGEGERATSTMREARVTLPEGMQVAAGAANWIGTCSDAQVGYHKEVDTNCPDASKLGTATFISPALSVPIEGTIYQRAPEPGRQLGLWLTADALGLHIKLPGSLEPDKTTGRLTAVFTDLPQVPVSEIDLDVWGGPRAPLQNPDRCGAFTTDFTFAPHSDDPAASGQSTMQITEGCSQPFDPTLHAGVTDPVAGKYSPFVFDLTRPDANQALRGFELHLPDGELAKIKGVPLCSDADASAATCPQGSRIGHLQATTGPGPEPFTLPEPGKPSPQIYLSGPYKGAPFSIVSEVPAQAGPFDLGTLAVRSGLGVEPETGRAVVKADPLPQFFEGVGIAYRHLHAVVDRPEFSLNPTDCREMAVSAEATSTKGTVAHPQARFGVDGCKALKFKPKLSLALRGGTRRASYPALTAVLKARKGDANIAFASVALPHSEFLAQQHIGTICTRVQFAADKCPKGSVYGKAKAITPLLDKPLAGPVYLRSSNHPLPDLVAKLGGQLEIDLVGRIDSIHGGIRTTFESVPDAPVSKFVLQMRGGRKGLLTNSTDICRGAHRATVAMKAQNGRAARLRPVLVARGCGHK